tara:strand:+ start:37 stop:966 length:930 start_codon:yes stop_codon:yes gene_type:complete
MRSYSEALKADSELGSYIAQRKKILDKGFDKTSDAYKSIQNKINAAYGVSKRYEMSDNYKRAQAATSGGSNQSLNIPAANTTTVKPAGNTGGTLMNRANPSASSSDPKEFLKVGDKNIEVKSIKLSSGKTSDVANIPTNFETKGRPGRAGTIQEGYEGVAKTLKQGGMRLNPVSAKTGNQTEIKRESSINRTADNDAALMRGLGSRKEVRQAVKSGFIGKDQKKSAMSYAKANKQLAKQERKSTSAADKSQSFGTKTKTKTIKVGAERDIHGNIVQGGRAAGTYQRTKTVSIDPTSGKKVKTREYKRIS